MIWLLLLLALVVRLINLNQSLWLDEAINVVAAVNLDFFSFIARYPVGDFHPPLYFTFLWIWSHLFGFSEIIVRMPSVIFGTATVYFTYLIGKKMISKRGGLIAGLLLALSPLHIYYSQEARMYSLATLAVTMSFYFYLRLVRGDKGDAKDWGGYLISLAMVLYSDYLAYLIIPVQLISTLLFYRTYFSKVLITILFSGLCLLPWLSIFLAQLEAGREAVAALSGWKAVVGGTGIKEIGLLGVKALIGRISFDNKILYGAVVGVAGIPYLFLLGKLGKFGKWGKEGKVLLLWLGVPPVLAFLISFFIPVFAYFRLIFILPALYLLITRLGLEGKVGLGRLGGWGIFGVILISEMLFSGMYLVNDKFWREDWRSAVAYVERSSIPVVLENSTIFSPYLYYSRKESAVPGLTRLPPAKVEDIILFSNKENSVYLFEYLVDVTDPQRLLEQSLRIQGFKKMETKDFRGVGFITRYERL